jgi:N-acetylneuraminic acid mutarotase
VCNLSTLAPEDATSTTTTSGADAVTARPSWMPGLPRRLIRRILWFTDDEEEAQPAQAVFEASELLVPIGAYAGALTTRRLSVVAKRVREHFGASRLAGVGSGSSPCLTSSMIYACSRSGGTGVASVDRYCPLTGEWETLPPMLTTRRACAVASTGGKLYVMGGAVRMGPPTRRYISYLKCEAQEEELQELHDVCLVECFDPALCRWLPCPPVEYPRTHAAAAALGGAIYLVGGLLQGHVFSQAHRFWPDSSSWEAINHMPTPRFECAAASANRCLYVLGGAPASGEPLSAFECFNSHANTWESLPPMPNPRFGCAAVAAKGNVYVIGGYGNWCSLAYIDCFDPEHRVWFSIDPMPVPRNHCGAAVSGSSIYVFGGSFHSEGDTSTGEMATIDRFDLDGCFWQPAGSMPCPKGNCLTTSVSC